MKVKELIEKLETLDQDKEIVYKDCYFDSGCQNSQRAFQGIEEIETLKVGTKIDGEKEHLKSEIYMIG